RGRFLCGDVVFMVEDGAALVFY
ncbi:uncharacterized, partial [Tachysurus ichikawai]